jgi:hypothetical protein
MTAKPAKWDGEDRRKMTDGRRVSDKCSEHCFYVKQLEELKITHKEDQKTNENRLKGAAPLWSVLVLITLVAGSVAYTFKTASSISRDIADRMGSSNAMIQTSLFEIKRDLEVAKSRQSDIKVLLEKHIQKYESMNGYNR